MVCTHKAWLPALLQILCTVILLSTWFYIVLRALAFHNFNTYLFNSGALRLTCFTVLLLMCSVVYAQKTTKPKKPAAKPPVIQPVDTSSKITNTIPPVIAEETEEEP